MTRRRPQMRRMDRTVALTLAGAILLAAPARAADPALYAAAKSEREVVWYTSLIVTQAVRPLVDAFNKKYPGIDVRFARADSGPNAIKIMTEARAGNVQGDVFDGIDTIPPLMKAGLVEPFVPSDAGKYPSGLRDADGRWQALVLYFLTAAVNTDLVPAAQRRARRRRTCSIRGGTAGSRGATYRPRARRSMSARCCRPWATMPAWRSCARCASRTSSMSTPPTGRSSIR